MLGNGIATHIAFLGIGLPRLLPAVDGTVLHYGAWFGPLVVAVIAKLVLDRRWKPKVARSRDEPRERAAFGRDGKPDLCTAASTAVAQALEPFSADDVVIVAAEASSSRTSSSSV